MNFIWCRRRDSNSHSFRHYHLKIACLPISPRRLHFCVQQVPDINLTYCLTLDLEFTLKIHKPPLTMVNFNELAKRLILLGFGPRQTLPAQGRWLPKQPAQVLRMRHQ